MKTTLEALQNTLKTLREMTPAEYGAMDNDAWQLTQDIADCCSAICGRVDALDRLAPIPAQKICPPEIEIDTLYDSETNDAVTPAELGISEERYEELVTKSAALGDGNRGHVVIGETGRKVYASY